MSIVDPTTRASARSDSYVRQTADADVAETPGYGWRSARTLAGFAIAAALFAEFVW